MNLYLHGIGVNSAASPIVVNDSLLASPGGERFDMVLTNPPFGKKSSVTFTTDEGETRRETQTIVRDDFWATTSNKQLNFVQHIKTLLKPEGKAAVVVPDNVLFEGGAGETIRRKLLHSADVHTLLRLPTRHFLCPGGQGQRALFRRQAGQRKTRGQKRSGFMTCAPTRISPSSKIPLTRADLDDFVTCFQPANRHERMPTWSELTPEGRWRCYPYEELIARDKVNLDIFWLRDDSLEETAALPDPDLLAAEIVEELQAALEQFREITLGLGEEG